MLAMAAYPEVQKKAQEELDSVIGHSRMPTLADRDSLPYIRATVREALRWRTVAPVGEPFPKMKLVTGPRLTHGWRSRNTSLYHGSKSLSTPANGEYASLPYHFSRMTGTKDTSFQKVPSV